MDFGDFCYIEQKRYGVKNEMYLHKVTGTKISNSYVTIPVESVARETIHTHLVKTISCICCGVSEKEILNYKEIDCKEVD